MLWKGIFIKILAAFYAMQSLFGSNEAIPVNNSDLTTALQNTDVFTELNTTNAIVYQTTTSPIQEITSVSDEKIYSFEMQILPDMYSHEDTIDITYLIRNTKWMEGTSSATRMRAVMRLQIYVEELADTNSDIVLSDTTTYKVIGFGETIKKNYFTRTRQDGDLEVYMGDPVTFHKSFEIMAKIFPESTISPIIRPLMSGLNSPDEFVALVKESPENKISPEYLEDILSFILSPTRNNIEVQHYEIAKNYKLATVTLLCGSYPMQLFADASEMHLQYYREWIAKENYVLSSMHYVVKKNDTILPMYPIENE